MSTEVCLCCLCKFNEAEGGFVTCDMSKCRSCNASVTSGCYALCHTCSAEQDKCYKCGKAVQFDKQDLETYIDKLTKKRDDLVTMYDKYLPESKQKQISIDAHQLMVDELLNGRRNFF